MENKDDKLSIKEAAGVTAGIAIGFVLWVAPTVIICWLLIKACG